MTQRDRDILISALVAVRASVDAALGMLGREDAQEQEPAKMKFVGGVCQHLDRLEIATMGGNGTVICRDCGLELVSAGGA